MNQNARNIKILGSGKYLPERVVYSTELDAKMNLVEGTVEQKSGVHERRFVTDEKLVDMGVPAAERALEDAGVKKEELDLIISACAISQQPLPCTAALFQRGLGLEDSGIPCFDINATCLSFVTALDTVSYLIEAGRYDKVLIISADIASCGINYNQLESASLFGDAAVAFVISKTPVGEQSKIINSHMKTYSSGADMCEIRGGLSAIPGYNYDGTNREDYLFNMKGKEVFKLSAKLLPQFVLELLMPSKTTLNDIGQIIPHQASLSSILLMQRKLNIPDDKIMITIRDHGNTIASSIPIALHESIKQKRLAREDTAFLLGTSAGISLGGMLLQY